MHQTHQVVFLLFDGHLTAIFDATKLPQFLVLPIYTMYTGGLDMLVKAGVFHGTDSKYLILTDLKLKPHWACGEPTTRAQLILTIGDP